MSYSIISSYSNFFPYDSYLNTISLSTFEFIAYITYALAYNSLKIKKLFLIAFSISLFGSIALYFSDKEARPELDMILTFTTKFGISLAYMGVYSTIDLFPVIF